MIDKYLYPEQYNHIMELASKIDFIVDVLNSKHFEQELNEEIINMAINVIEQLTLNIEKTIGELDYETDDEGCIPY